MALTTSIQHTNLVDSFGREFPYLRLSVTDACNFRCTYCLPHGYVKSKTSQSHLSREEIVHLVRAFAELGTWKIRLTGGEPTLRRDLLEIVRDIKQIPGIRKIALSTNGYRLKDQARDLFEAGVTALNVSVDSLDPGRFEKLTGSSKLFEIIEGIDTASSVGFKRIKINAVLMADTVDKESELFLKWIRTAPITVRFIELMPTGQNTEFFKAHHVQGSQLAKKLVSDGWALRPRLAADGPAQEFEHPDYQGRIGLIAPYSKDFCQSCNRLRVTSQGALRLCLFGEGGTSLRHYLQSPDQMDDLKELVTALLNKKEISHYLPEGRFGNNQTFSAMGG